MSANAELVRHVSELFLPLAENDITQGVSSVVLLLKVTANNLR